MASIRRDGVDFHNSHSLYPTVTTPNASAIATGHGLGDTGDFGNDLWVGFPTTADSPSSIADLEDDEALGSMNRHYGGNYLNETTVLPPPAPTASPPPWSASSGPPRSRT